MEMNFLAEDIETGAVYRIWGCTSAEEAREFIGENQRLLCLTDEQITNIIITED